METTKFDHAIQLFDAYNTNDPKIVSINEREIPDALLYAQRMTAKLNEFEPDASEHLQLASRCQHIGRWEMPRKDYPMDRTGYLRWRSELKIYHAKIASDILEKVGYEKAIVSKVKDLLLKKQLKQNPETQILEDVICLVFLEYYFDDFSSEHDEEKLVNILKKTIAKMSEHGQIEGGMVDGPMALDVAINKNSAEIKGFTSPVAGDADCLLFPNIDAANVFYKTKSKLCKAEMAGIIAGAKVPAVVSSRGDSEKTKLNSIALASLIS